MLVDWQIGLGIAGDRSGPAGASIEHKGGGENAADYRQRTLPTITEAPNDANHQERGDKISGCNIPKRHAGMMGGRITDCKIFSEG
jgi:hypothetical protein